VIGGVHVIEAEDDMSADRAAYASLDVRGLLETQARHHPRGQALRDAWMEALGEMYAAWIPRPTRCHLRVSPAGGRLPSSVDRGQGEPPGRRGWRACSVRSRDSHSRCIR
jgi:hypothetical protein